jgi:transcription elongation factor GreA
MNIYNIHIKIIGSTEMDKKPISRQGFDALVKELKQLQEVERPEILKVVQWARSLGDLSENADYSAARERQREIDKRIQYIENFINNASVIDVDNLSGDRVVFGARVLCEDENGNRMQCRILSDIESDGKQVISCTSPVGRALIGRCVGDTCVVRLPSGEREYEILDIKFKE